MGGSKTVIEQPTPPAAPTTAQNMSDFVNNYPALMALEKQYNPQQAQLQYDLTAQYAPQYSELMKTTNEALYPGITEMNAKLTEQAKSGMDGAVPDAMRQQYLDQMRAELGPNSSAGIGADYISRNLINQQQEYNNYYRNLALTLTGRQPLTQAQAPAFQNVGEGYNYGAVSGANMAGYGSYASLYGGMYGANQQAATASMQAPYGLIGAGFQGLGALGGGFLSRR